MSRKAVCPITLAPFTDPVVASDGWTYERGAIVQWMLKSDRSPLVADHVLSRALYPNYAMRALPTVEWREVIVID
jgi:E3 ubiquitin-protein ligase RGLG